MKTNYELRYAARSEGVKHCDISVVVIPVMKMTVK